MSDYSMGVAGVSGPGRARRAPSGAMHPPPGRLRLDPPARPRL